MSGKFYLYIGGVQSTVIIKPKKEEILNEFVNKYVDEKWINEFIEIDEIYKSDKEAIEENLILTFDKVCKLAKDLQEKESKGDIKYIYFSLLRSNIIEDIGEYRIDLYDENWVLDKEECSINIDLNFIYSSLFKQKKELKEKKKEYGKSISDMDVENIIFKEIDKYHILAVEFLKELIEKLINISSYEEMKKSEDIVILAGEYMDETEIIYSNKER